MDLPYLTSALEGTGGTLRATPDDFRVDEIPLYAPCGEGEHLFVRIRKRGLATFEAVRRVASALGLRERDVSYAGLKDARAVTTQWLCLSGVEEDAVRALAVPRLAVLDMARHTNKLKLGHLRGNRFRIVVREAGAGAVERAAAILDEVVRRGAPNYFGSQRFGARLTSHHVGEAILRGDHERAVRALVGGPSDLERDPLLREARRLFDAGQLQEAYATLPVRYRAEKKALHALLRFGSPERAWFAVPMRMRQMLFSSFQSHLFNRVVVRRLDTFDRMEAGDLAYLHRNGAVFRVVDAAATQARCDAFEISPSAPIFGTRCPLAEGAQGERERAVLAEAGATKEDFDVSGGLRARGQRRSIRAPLREVVLEDLGNGAFAVSFALPSGAFATAVMREILKRAV